MKEEKSYSVQSVLVVDDKILGTDAINHVTFMYNVLSALQTHD